MITLVPHGGLCNRMRAIASTARLARLHGRALRVRWLRNADLNCAFGSLFLADRLPCEVVEVDATGFRAPWARLRRRLEAPWLAMRGIACSTEAQSARFLEAPEQLQALVSAHEWVVHSHSKLMDGPDLFEIFEPVAELHAVVERQLPRLRNAVGVHIRRSDNLQAIAHGPVSSFVQRMKEQADAAPGCEFFVATDSPQVYAEVSAAFPGRVFSHPKASLRRDDPAAIRDAVVDLWCLAHCRSLIGSYWSSFTDTAWELRGIPHLIVRDP